MKALVITTKDIAYVHDFAPPMSESIEKFIGDWTETVRPRGIPGYLMLVDESGLLKHLPCNLAALFCTVLSSTDHRLSAIL